MFYIFLIMKKQHKPNIKFIISGAYNQLKQIHDIISPKTDYAKSPCLFELPDYNWTQLPIHRRADDTLYSLIKYEMMPNVEPSYFEEREKQKNNIHAGDAHAAAYGSGGPIIYMMSLLKPVLTPSKWMIKSLKTFTVFRL